jgi:UDP-N-acetylmuramoyl-L-alanyl-D-glutamate--2,6-diaminopimelate ligase
VVAVSLVAVVNADSPHATDLIVQCRIQGHRIISYGEAGEAIRITRIAPTAQGQDIELSIMGAAKRLHLPLAGTFQAANALCALGLVIGTGGDLERSLSALERLEGVPGRLQNVAATKKDAAIYVDYAHTPDALATVLKALRPHAAGRLVVVFGCGGDRDPGKRPEMGHIAADMADAVIVTDDNPRSEDAAAIRAAVMKGCPGAREIGDRHEAIMTAVRELGAGDLLLLAGKGHESGQIVKDRTLPFDDAVEARRAVAELDA